MKNSLTIMKVAGTRIRLHWTFLVLIGLLVLTSSNVGQLWNTAFILTVFLCVVLHEFGHVIAARHYGIQTKEITLLPIGGIAHLDRIPESPRQELMVALAGPLVNLGLAAVLFFPVRHELGMGLEKTLVAISGHNFIVNLFMVNLSLFVFNLLPVFPMDGGRVLRALLAFRMERVKATRIAARIGQAHVVLFVIGSIFYSQLSSNPFLILIGFFVFFAAQTELRAVELRSFLSGFQVESITMKDYRSIQTTDSLSKVVEWLLTSQTHDFVVYDGQKLAGTLSRTRIVKSVADGNLQVPVGDIMQKDFSTVESNVSIAEIFDAIQRSKDRFMLVTKNNKLLGVVDFENLLEFIMVKRATKFH